MTVAARYTMGMVNQSLYYNTMMMANNAANAQSAGIERTNLPKWVEEQKESISDVRESAMMGIMAFSALGVIGEANTAGNILMTALSVMMAATGVYSAMRAMYLSREAIQSTIASAEAAAAAIAQNWVGLAIAGAAAATVYATFSVVSHANVSTPQGRREVESTMKAVSSSG